ncbi:ABC transporter permease [Heyndrickxia sp. NPDC080065]|uniref:ABC transporter permease n=1 Tax=Heyndrickxia sp. NPDC080065 TaxID=3390568 RepID=UPI003D02243C
MKPEASLEDNTKRLLISKTKSFETSWIRQYQLLMRIQFSDYKSSFPFFILIGIILPLGFLWIQSSINQEKGYHASWYLAGNLMLSVVLGSAGFVIARMAWLRIRKELDYYGTLPIRKIVFILSLFTLSQCSSLPGLAITLIIGKLLLEIPLYNIIIAVPITLIATCSLIFVGAALGSISRTMGEVNLYSNLLTVFVVFLSPVFAPLNELPFIIKLTSYVLPTGQAILCLTDAFSGNFNLHFWLLLIALILWLVICGFLVLKKLDWKKDY